MGTSRTQNQEVKIVEEIDVFRQEAQLKKMFKTLDDATFSSFEENNEMVKKYVNAKFQGNYRHLVYDCNSPERTTYKNLVVLRKIFGILDKPCSLLKEEDIIELQGKLNRNEVLTFEKNQPIAQSYKQDMVKNFKQFWTFYRAYKKHEEGIIIEDITEYFRIRKEKNKNLMVKFLTKTEIDQLSIYAKSLKKRALIKVFFETGARPVEILNLKMQNCDFDESIKKWTIKLRNMKGISTGKMPIELDYANKDFDAYMKEQNFAPDEFLFGYAYTYFRKFLAREGKRVLGRHVTPKMFRKSCAMHLVNLDINEQYIKSHMGWSASSKAISHYINQRAIKKPSKLTDSFSVKATDELQAILGILQSV